MKIPELSIPIEERTKVLFVCRANIGRSQVAMSYANHFGILAASSAGTIVDNPGQRLRDWSGAENVIKAMEEEGIDIGDNRRTPVAENMGDHFDKVVYMGEPEVLVPYMEVWPNFESWEVPDFLDRDYADTLVIRDSIKERVRHLGAISLHA